MPKKPSFQFYYGDWKRDAYLSKCSPSTRGIWMDLICDMHDLDQCGEITGTLDQLARSCRCSPEEMEQAISELSATKTADVTKRNKDIHIINRRMQKEYKERKDNRIRQMRYREKHNNENITDDNGKITVASSTSSSFSSSKSIKTTIPDDFCLTEKMIGYAKSKRVTNQKILQDFTEQFILANKSKGYKYLDWYATWQNWFRRAMDEGKIKPDPKTSKENW